MCFNLQLLFNSHQTLTFTESSIPKMRLESLLKQALSLCVEGIWNAAAWLILEDGVLPPEGRAEYGSHSFHCHFIGAMIGLNGLHKKMGAIFLFDSQIMDMKVSKCSKQLRTVSGQKSRPTKLPILSEAIEHVSPLNLHPANTCFRLRANLGGD